MGLLSGVAGMVSTAYLNAANPKDGVGFELDAIAAVFIGGAAVAGGIGTVSGSMVGGLVMGVLNLGLANLSVDSNFIQIIKGMVLLLAVAFDVRSKLQGRPSFIGMMMSGMNRRSSPPRPRSSRRTRTQHRTSARKARLRWVRTDSGSRRTTQGGPLSLTVEPFGTLHDGSPVARYTLSRAGGLTLRVLTYGGIVQSLEVPDAHGENTNVVLGFASLKGISAAPRRTSVL
jgi:hypothetical protein